MLSNSPTQMVAKALIASIFFTSYNLVEAADEKKGTRIPLTKRKPSQMTRA